jgi:hypothetical protein
MTAPTLERKIDFLRSSLPDVTHASSVPFLDHLIGVRQVLAGWQARPSLCDAGLFHSVYGTQYFRPGRPLDRDEVRGWIGDEAESVAWLWCFADRHTLGANGARDRDLWLRHRDGDERIPIDRQQLEDLANLWAADAFEQADRLADDEMGFARGLVELHALQLPAAAEALAGIAERIPRQTSIST